MNHPKYIMDYVHASHLSFAYLGRIGATINLLLLLAVHASGQAFTFLSTEKGLTSSLVTFLHEDRYGLIWIATEDGLNRYDGVKITTYKHRKGDCHSLASNYVSSLIADANGNLIVGTYKGVQIYRYDSDDFSPLATLPDGRPMNASINVMHLAPDGRLYGAGGMSCEILTSGNKKVEVRQTEKPYFPNRIIASLPRELNVRTFMRYDNNHLLLGTDSKGLKLYDEQRHTYSDYPLDIPGFSQSLEKVRHIEKDHRGNLWIALYQKGVVMVSQRRSMFGYIGSRTTQKNIIGSHCILSLCRGKDGGLWVGTDGDGLYRLYGSSSQHLVQGVPPIINSVIEDSDGRTWIGSFGYPCYSGTGGVFTPMAGLPEQANVFAIREDRNRRIWLGTMGYGVYCYDMQKKSLSWVSSPVINKYVNCLYVLSNGHVLAGTFNGIYNITTHRHLCEQRIVYAIHEDRHGRLWVGTSDGLLVVDGDHTKTYTTSDGMPSNSVFAISEDERGLIWFSSNAGLSCFDELGNIFTNYSVSDGLQGNEFSKGALLKDTDGTLWFAGHGGITYFQPSAIARHQYVLHPRLTALYINNVPANTRTLTGGEPVMTDNIYQSQHFSIAYENNSFSIELSSEETDAPAECTYAYSLDDEPWATIPEGGHLVTFSNLDAGSHILRYAVEYNGKRSEVKQVEIDIRRPWWNSWLTRLLLSALLLFIFALVFFWIKSREKVKALALISHKIRTPMSLIISPLTQLIDTDADPDRQATYRLMLRNAERLQHLAAQATEEEPIGPIRSNEAQETAPASLQKSHTSRHLLIVEDDDEVRNYLCRALSSSYHIREARNGKEALALVFRHAPDAIISDVTMPEMDGIALCRKLKKNIQFAHIPVILLTARADEESMLQGLGIGADAYITKPFNIKILQQSISNLILLRQQLYNTYHGKQLQDDKLEAVETEDSNEIFMQRVMASINSHLSESDFSVDVLCREVGISRASLHRKLKDQTNQSASIFIRNVRLRQAEKLLTTTTLRVNEIAARVGFKNLSYFINSFRELYGVSPTEWKSNKDSANPTNWTSRSCT